MQSNSKVIQSLISKIQSPLTEIKNRAITTLYTKVSAKIISDQDLVKANELPGVLFNWVNQTTPTNKDCLYKTLSILHRYTLSQQGLKLLCQYEAMEFLQELRKFLMANETNVDQHVDIIKKIIKALLPLENTKMQNKKQEKDRSINQNQLEHSGFIRQQQNDYDDSQQEQNQASKKLSKSTKQQGQHYKKQNEKQKKQRHVIQFYCLNQYLPKIIDQQLYSLMIQLKHGKKQTILQTLIKIQQILLHWGYRYFGYKQQLIRQLVIVIQGKVFSQVACRILSILLKQCLQMEEDIGVVEFIDYNNQSNLQLSQQGTLLRTIKINNNSFTNSKAKTQPISLSLLKKLRFELKFEIFHQNPFPYLILQTVITKNKSQKLSPSVIQYLLTAVTKYNFSASFLPELLQKIIRNQKWLTTHFLTNKFYQQSIILMIDHCCEIQNNIYQHILPFIQKLFPNKSLQQMSQRIPKLSAQLKEQQIQQSFRTLAAYSQTKGVNNNTFKSQQFDFNLQLHNLQSHIKNLQTGIAGLPKKPQIISLYIDCLLMLAVSVAKQDPLMSYYPKIKSLIIKVAEHEYLNCRQKLYEGLLMAFNSSGKINYLAQSFLKSQLIRLVFSDGQFFQALFIKALNQSQTLSIYLEIIKLIQSTMKEENRKYLNKFTPLFYLLSFPLINEKQPKTDPNSNEFSIASASKIIVSRTPKKYQVTNILLSLFCKVKQQRKNTYTEILGLPESQDLLEFCLQQLKNQQKKHLKYSLSTIRNYMGIILNNKLQASIKSSAIEQMIECSQRLDLSVLEKDHQFLKEILSIRNSVEEFIKSFLNEQSNNLPTDRSFFMSMVRIYSILQRRLRVQTNYLNQSGIKSLQPQVYLNVLINLCMIWQQDEIKSHSQFQFKQVIYEFLLVVYYHVMTSFSSNLILDSTQSLVQRKKNVIMTHWILQRFPHQKLIPTQLIENQLPAKRDQFFSSGKGSNNFILSEQKQKIIVEFLKIYRLNIKSAKQLLLIYIQSCTENKPQNTSSQTLKIKSNSICPILQRQLSAVIHNLNSSHNEVSFLTFLIESLGQKYSSKLFDSLQQIIPHIMNQLQKPNVPSHINIMLIRICNAIGWKRTKSFDSLLNQFSTDEMYYLSLFNKLPKLGGQQLGKIIKIVLSQIENPKCFRSISLLWQILLKPANLKALIFSSTEYTQLLVLNSLLKCIQNVHDDQKLTNFSIILLHQFLNEVYFQLRKIPLENLLKSNEFDQGKDITKVIELIKLICSLLSVSSLIRFVLQQFQKSQSDDLQNQSLTLQSFCFLLEALKAVLTLQNFAVENGLNIQINLNHQAKIIKQFMISLNDYIRSNPQFMNYSSLSMFFSSVLNFINCLLKNSTFCQSASHIDLLDFSVTLLYEKSKTLTKNSPNTSFKRRQSETYLLFSSIVEYNYLRMQQNPKENSHYLLSSTTFLQASINILLFLKNNSSSLEKNEKAKIYIRQLLQKFGKTLHSISLTQEDYFIFKLNHVCQQLAIHNLLQTISNLNKFGDLNFLIFFMRLVLLWQGKTSSQKLNQQKTTQFQILNPIQIFQDQEQEDDSSLEQREVFSKDKKPKNPFENNWIYQLVDLIVQRGHIRHCKSLIALSIPAKMFLLQKSGFVQYLKKMTSLIDSKIIYESNSSKKKTQKKPNIAGNSSVLLSNSRRSVVSQNLSYLAPDNNSSEDEKLAQIQDFIKFLTSLFAVHENLNLSEKQQFYVSGFTSNLYRFKEILRKVFYSVDKLYTLSQLLSNQSKEMSKSFMKMVNALSESVIFSQSLSNHLTEVTSPMLEQSISTLLKGLSQPIGLQDSQKLKQSLRLLSTLSNHESVRSYIYKSKLIQELNSRMIRYEQKKIDKTDFFNLNSLYDIVGFYLNLSKYKDSHNKILNDKKVLEVLINQVYMQKSNLISEKILELLSNLSAYKLNKAVFMQNRQIHKTILGQLESSEIEYKCHLLTLMYNLMYRHAPAVKLYKRKQVIEMLQQISWQHYENWQNVKHIKVAILQVLKSESQVPDKS